MQYPTSASVAASKSFNDVCRYGICRPADLGSELVLLERRKSFERKTMDPDE
jgi:hypothetical protein